MKRFVAAVFLLWVATMGFGAVGATGKAIRGNFLHFIDDPFARPEEETYDYLEDGLLWIQDGHVKALGPATKLLRTLPLEVPVTHYPDSLIVPGFVDTHVHYPQIGMIASYGAQLLDWLNQYTFPTEEAFHDKAHAKSVARFFLSELLSGGTTTALVFGTVHKASVDAFFEEAETLNLRMIAGKVMMDRNAPSAVSDKLSSGYIDSKALIQKWHGKGRLLYALTPRFAITSTREQLKDAQRLKEEFPEVYLQTHLSENVKEILAVKSLFPENSGYLDVYDSYHLLGPHSVFAHGIHLFDEEIERLAVTHSAISFCPTSNLFLGSGLFPLTKMVDRKQPVNVSLGTDVGAGTSLSQLQTMNEAYKVLQLQGYSLSPLKAFYLATLGGAKALALEKQIGNFEEGKEADFVVLNPSPTRVMAYRMQSAKTVSDKLFALMILGDERAVKATYVLGEPFTPEALAARAPVPNLTSR